MAGLALILRLRISEPRTPANAKANGIPVVHCPAGERKNELAEEYLAKTKITQGSNAGKDATPLQRGVMRRSIELIKTVLPYHITSLSSVLACCELIQ